MRSQVLPVHQGLAGSSRLPAITPVGHGSAATSLVVLMVAGVAAALATTLLDLSLRIPGHAILRAVLPMGLGLAIAPRRMGGMVMGAAACGTALALTHIGSFTVGVGALTSLVLVGPFLDVALWRVRRGWRLYLAFALAGLVCNLVALTVRAGVKFGGLDHTMARPLAVWLMPAVRTYALCGALAGLLSALAWFRFSPNRQSGVSEPES